MQPVYAFVSSARRSVDVTMYELVDRNFNAALESDAARGVTVRVVLDVNREKAANRAAYAELTSHGVRVVWADPRYAATHEKAIVVDGTAAAVMSLNLASRYYHDTRDFAVLDRQAADVAAIEQVFDADFTHAKTATPVGADLVWSPGQSEPVLVHLIDHATSTLLVENEEMGLASITTALEKAAGRGVKVTVVMTRQSSWAKAFDKLGKAHVAVYTLASNAALYIHAKAVVADAGTARQQAFVGSENFSAASLHRNRELGILTADASVVTGLADTIRKDAAAATRWST